MLGIVNAMSVGRRRTGVEAMMGVYPCPYCGGMVTRELTCLPPFLMAQTPGGLPRFLECRACELRERQRAFSDVATAEDFPNLSPGERLRATYLDSKAREAGVRVTVDQLVRSSRTDRDDA